MVTLKCNGVYKTYLRSNRSVTAITDCNIKINRGECVTISGMEGSGKTTLLNLLGGLERPSCGSVYFNQRDISLLTDDELAMMRRKEIGYLFQNDSLIPELNVHENIIIPALLASIKYDEGYYKELTDRFKISEILNRYPKELSETQRQCVAYARALINQPELILLDEPVTNLDQQIDNDILDFLLNLVYKNNMTLVIVTNNPEISIYGDHIIRLMGGVVVEDRIIYFNEMEHYS